MKCYDISRHIRSASNNDETLSEYNRIYNEIYNIYRSYILNIEKMRFTLKMMMSSIY